MIKGDFDKAIEANHKALEMNPNLALAHNNLAHAYARKKMYAPAIEHADKAVGLGLPVSVDLLEELSEHR